MKRLLTILTAIILILAISLQSEAKEKSLIYTIDIKKEIDNTTWIYLHNGLSEAKQLSADAILLHMNTYGGLLESADSMRTAILYSPIPVYVFIDNNAASAGALPPPPCRRTCPQWKPRRPGRQWSASASSPRPGRPGSR